MLARYRPDWNYGEKEILMEIRTKLLKYNRFISENKEYLFWLAYIMYIAELLFFTSVYREFDSMRLFLIYVRNIACIIVCMKVLLDFLYGEYSKKELVLITVGTVLLIVSAKFSGSKTMLVYWVFIIAAHDIELERIVKAAVMVHFACMLIIIASSVWGIIEDRIYTQGSDRVRASLGYLYTTDSSNYFFRMILMYIYVKKEKISWESIGALELCNILLFKFTDTRNAFVLGTLALFVAGVWKLFRRLRNNNIIYKAGAVLTMPIMSAIMICLTFFYNPQIKWMWSLNKFINERLSLGYSAYKNYGLHLWGKSIQWIGGANNYITYSGEYNYVDSSYVQIILNYGIIIFLLVCLLFIVLGWKASKINDIYLILVLVIIALHSALDPQLFWMAFNPFIMCYSYLNKCGYENHINVPSHL